MTLYADIELQVKTNCGGRDNDEFLASILFNANHVLTWLSTQHRWPELERQATPSLVVDQTSYTKTELGILDVKTIYNVRLFDGSVWWKPMSFLPKHRFDQTVKTGSVWAPGKPESFTMFAQQVVFSRKPDAAYALEIDYVAKPTKLVDGSSVIPYDDLDGALVYLLSGYGWLGIGDGANADKWFKLGVDQLTAIGVDTTSLLNFQHTPNEQVRSSAGQPWLDPFQRR